MGMQVARGQRPQIGDLFTPFRRIVPVFATCLIVALMMLVGLAFFVLPGLIVIGLFSLAPLAAYEQEMGPGEALKWSFEVSKPHMWSIMALGFVTYLIASLGGCACYVGYLFTGSVPGIVLGLTYMTFRSSAPAANPFAAYPPSGPIAPPPVGGTPPPPAGL
ncbi:hypothetical protein EON77_16500 [bacterium]|nr:MAG: hypothetical protein EON77_16500 [bacterium]